MASNIEIYPIRPSEYYILSVLVGELLYEIMEKIGDKAFNFNLEKTEVRVNDLISNDKYWIFIAKEKTTNTVIGFVSLYESYALYAEGAYGTIPELYVKKNWRSQSVGRQLLKKVRNFAHEKRWHRVEVTTPPLPIFDRTLSFYKKNDFQITGGRKLKIDINT